MKITINNRQALVTEYQPMIAGSVGQYTAEVSFSDDWQDYDKFLVFSNNSQDEEQARRIEIHIAEMTSTVDIPWEIISRADMLMVGAYGLNGDKVKPTVYSSLFAVISGVEPGDAAHAPTIVPWEQMRAWIGDLSELETQAKDSLVHAINEALQAHGVTAHNELSGRDAENAHPISAVDGLADRLDAIDEALGDKADAADVAEEFSNVEREIDGKADADSVPSKLEQLESDAQHRTVSDAEKDAWNGKADAEDIPSALSELEDDSTHRTVSDAEKAAWNGKAPIHINTDGQMTDEDWFDLDNGIYILDNDYSFVVEIGTPTSYRHIFAGTILTVLSIAESYNGVLVMSHDGESFYRSPDDSVWINDRYIGEWEFYSPENGLVGYGWEQTLTDEEKAQARSNIGAPATANEMPYEQLSSPAEGSVEEAVSQVKSQIANKLTEPSSGLAVGKYFRIASIDADGHAVLEAVDDPATVKGIKVAGTELTPDADGKVNVPIAQAGTAGAAVGVAAFSTDFTIDNTNRVQVNPADQSDIQGKTSTKALTPSGLDYAVRAGLLSNSQITDADKPTICNTIGAECAFGELICDTTVDLTAATVIDKDSNNNAFELSRMAVLVDVPANTPISKAYHRAYAGTAELINYYLIGKSSVDATSHSLYIATAIGDFKYAYVSQSGGDAFTDGSTVMLNCGSVSTNTKGFTGFRVAVSSTKADATARVRIYGVRK